MIRYKYLKYAMQVSPAFILLIATGCGGTGFLGGPQSKIPNGETAVDTGGEKPDGGGENALPIDKPLETHEAQLRLLTDNIKLVKEFQQTERPVYREDYVQGTREGELTELFSQNSLGLLDIVLVMDNSGSMREEQVNLSKRLAPLVSFIARSDWRIAIATTDPADGCVKRVVSTHDADRDKIFRDTILSLGTQGAGVEVGLSQAVEALRCGKSTWMRANSNVAVIIVSDEDNCSNGKCPNETIKPASYLLNYLEQERELGVDAKVYGIVWEPGTDCDTGGYEAPIYAAAVNGSGGVMGSICSSDYAPILEEVSKDLFDTLKMQVSLKYTPLPGSLKVMVNGADFSNKVSLLGKTVLFATTPPTNAKIDITYRHQNGSLLRRFGVSQPDVDPGTIEVYVDNAALRSGEFRFDPATHEVELAKVPGEKLPVTIFYKPVMDLQKSFQVGKGYDGARMTVRLNEQEIFDWTYDKAEGYIELQAPPLDGVTIKVSLFDDGQAVLEYPFPTVLDQMQNVHAYAKADANQVFDITYQDGKVIFRQDQFEAGRVVVIRWDQ